MRRGKPRTTRISSFQSITFLLWFFLCLAHAHLVDLFPDTPPICSWFHPETEGHQSFQAALQRRLTLSSGAVAQETCRASSVDLLPQILGDRLYALYNAAEKVCMGMPAALDADLCATIQLDHIFSTHLTWNASAMKPQTRLEKHQRRLLAGQGRSDGEKMVVLNHIVSKQRREDRAIAPLGCRPNPYRFSLLLLGPQRYNRTLTWFRELSAQCAARKVTRRFDTVLGTDVLQCGRASSDIAHLCAVHQDTREEPVCDVDPNVLMMTMFGGLDGPLARIMAWEDECASRPHADCHSFCSWVTKTLWSELFQEREPYVSQVVLPSDHDDSPHEAAATGSLVGSAVLLAVVILATFAKFLHTCRGVELK